MCLVSWQVSLLYLTVHFFCHGTALSLTSWRNGSIPCNWQCHYGKPSDHTMISYPLYRPVEGSQWLEQGAMFSSWNGEFVFFFFFFFLWLQKFVCMFLFCKLSSISWNMKHAKRTCFQHSFTVRVVFRDWVERQIHLILSVFNRSVCGWLCNVYLK